MIYKLQRPIAGSQGSEGPIMAYTEGKKNHCFLPMSPNQSKLFGDRYKIFVEASRQGATLDIDRVVPDCGW